MTQASQKNCPDGYLCKGGAVHPSVMDEVTVALCPPGNTCKYHVSNPTQVACQPGTYQNMKGQIKCNVCRDGFDCPDKGMAIPNPCPEGYYCIGGKTTKCPAGTYNSLKYAAKITDCPACPPGKYCEIGSKAFTGYCDAGYVCTGGAPSAKPQGIFDKSSYVADSINPSSEAQRTYSTVHG